MSLDIFAPQISVVPKGIKGKTMLIYGSNRTGKTAQACQAEKPMYLAFEKGINGIPGIPFMPIQDWADFKKVNRQLTKAKTLEQVREMYQTIIFDTVSTAAFMCEQYVIGNAGVTRLNDMNGGFGGWKEYANEFWKEISMLTGCGFTVIFIAHETTREFQNEDGESYSKIYPDGDKRSIDPICNLVDIIAYIKTRGLDPSTGEERKSSALLVNTPEYHAGTRFDYMPKYLQEFTMANLEKALEEAITLQEKDRKGSTVDFSKFQKTYEKEEKDFDELVSEIGAFAKKLHELGRFSEYEELVSENLGQGTKVSEATKKQRQALEVIHDALTEMEIE